MAIVRRHVVNHTSEKVPTCLARDVQPALYRDAKSDVEV
jgi:hypothetical protein